MMEHLSDNKKATHFQASEATVYIMNEEKKVAVLQRISWPTQVATLGYLKLCFSLQGTPLYGNANARLTMNALDSKHYACNFVNVNMLYLRILSATGTDYGKTWRLPPPYKKRLDSWVAEMGICELVVRELGLVVHEEFLPGVRSVLEAAGDRTPDQITQFIGDFADMFKDAGIPKPGELDHTAGAPAAQKKDQVDAEAHDNLSENRESNSEVEEPASADDDKPVQRTGRHGPPRMRSSAGDANFRGKTLAPSKSGSTKERPALGGSGDLSAIWKKRAGDEGTACEPDNFMHAAICGSDWQFALYSVEAPTAANKYAVAPAPAVFQTVTTTTKSGRRTPPLFKGTTEKESSETQSTVQFVWNHYMEPIGTSKQGLKHGYVQPHTRGSAASDTAAAITAMSWPAPREMHWVAPNLDEPADWDNHLRNLHTSACSNAGRTVIQDNHSHIPEGVSTQHACNLRATG
jgi:hypothetical protein